MRRERLRLVVARRTHQVRRADDAAVQPGDEQLALGHQQHAAEIGLQRHRARRVHPAEAAAVDDRGVGRLAQRVQVVVGELGDALDQELRRRRRVGVRRAIASGRPAQEVAEDADADLLALLDVELRAGAVAGARPSPPPGRRSRSWRSPRADRRRPGRSCARNRRGRPAVSPSSSGCAPGAKSSSFQPICGRRSAGRRHRGDLAARSSRSRA